MLGISFTAKLLSTLMFFIANWFYRPIGGGDVISPPAGSTHPLSARSRENIDSTVPPLAYENHAVEVT